ncbi:leucine rich repeat serine [Echinococcus multilocularis]|uniref:Protein cbg n=1 Tax=Echinococcus multilocularis TaxID=6211 RepID=A0A0S4MNW9_ECHMU|nr:leucine rich repeat serine [Echinococcus multilocularis]
MAPLKYRTAEEFVRSGFHPYFAFGKYFFPFKASTSKQHAVLYWYRKEDSRQFTMVYNSNNGKHQGARRLPLLLLYAITVIH